MKKQIKEMFKEIVPDYSMDKWSGLMVAYFDIAAECFNRGFHVPDYKPGLSGAAVENEANIEYFESLNDTEMKRLLSFCSKLYYILDNAGLSY